MEEFKMSKYGTCLYQGRCIVRASFQRHPYDKGKMAIRLTHPEGYDKAVSVLDTSDEEARKIWTLLPKEVRRFIDL